MTRLEVCTDCTFYKGKCSFCGCSGKGVIDDPTSRCPRNLWEDGWGVGVKPCIDDINTETEVIFWDELLGRDISSAEIKTMIVEKGDPLYIFNSEYEFIEFVRLKNYIALN